MAASKGATNGPAGVPVFEVFFGGARGGGKTDGMLGEWASHAALHGKNAVGLMVRRERVQLLETIERSRHLYGPLGARYNDQSFTARARVNARRARAVFSKSNPGGKCSCSCSQKPKISGRISIPILNHIGIPGV